MKKVLVILFLALSAYAQRIGGGGSGNGVPIVTATPATCTPNRAPALVFVSATGASGALYFCSAVNTWSPIGSASVNITTSCMVSGGPITGTGALSASIALDSQAGAGAFAIPTGDCGKIVYRNNAAAVSDTLAQAGGGGSFPANWFLWYQCVGAGGCTITPTTSTINGGSSLTMPSGTGVMVQSDGTNYRTVGDVRTIPTVASTSSVLKGNGSGGAVAASSGSDFAPATSGSAILKGNGTGGFSSASAGTDYAAATSGSAILKGNGAGGFSNASAGTDYAAATSGSSVLKGNGAGGFSNASAGTDFAAANVLTAGTLGAIPGTCSTGQFYQATDQPITLQIYVCSSSNTWTRAGYTQGTTSAKPGTCSLGQMYFATDATAGQNLYFCTASNTWTQQLNSGGSGSGIVTQTTGSTDPTGACSPVASSSALTLYVNSSAVPPTQWFCDTGGTWQLYSSTTGIGPFVITGLAGTFSSGVLGSRPACNSGAANSLYLETGSTHALTACTNATGSYAWSITLNPSGYQACFFDSTDTAFRCYDSSGNLTTGATATTIQTNIGSSLSGGVTATDSGTTTEFIGTLTGSITGLTLSGWRVQPYSLTLTEGGSGGYTLVCSACDGLPSGGMNPTTVGTVMTFTGFYDGTTFHIKTVGNNQGYSVLPVGSAPPGNPGSGLYQYVDPANNNFPRVLNSSGVDGSYVAGATSATGGDCVQYVDHAGTQHYTACSGGSGGSVFTGSVATATTGIGGTAAAPTFSGADQSVKSPTIFKFTLNATNATVPATTGLVNFPIGAKFSIKVFQDAAHTFSFAGGVLANTPCNSTGIVTPPSGGYTEIFLEVDNAGAIWSTGCTDSSTNVTFPGNITAAGYSSTGSPAITWGTGSGYAGNEGTAPSGGCPAVGVDCFYWDPTAHAPKWSFNNSAFDLFPYAALSGTPSALPPNGSAGGDLSGSYPGPTVAKVNGNTPGNTCTNQFTRSISTSAVGTCASIANADLPTVLTSTTGGGLWIPMFPGVSDTNAVLSLSANAGYVLAITIQTQTDVTKVVAKLEVASASGSAHCDIGLYAYDGSSLALHYALPCASGSSTNASASTIAKVTLSPGSYWLAVCSDQTDPRMAGVGSGPNAWFAASGIMNTQTQKYSGTISGMCTAGTLPSSFTPSSISAGILGGTPVLYLMP